VKNAVAITENAEGTEVFKPAQTGFFLRVLTVLRGGALDSATLPKRGATYTTIACNVVIARLGDGL